MVHVLCRVVRMRMEQNAIEERFDKSVRLSQQLAEELSRSIQFSESSPVTSTLITETATQRADKLLTFDASGELQVTQEVGVFKGNSSLVSPSSPSITTVLFSPKTNLIWLSSPAGI